MKVVTVILVLQLFAIAAWSAGQCNPGSHSINDLGGAVIKLVNPVRVYKTDEDTVISDDIFKSEGFACGFIFPGSGPYPESISGEKHLEESLPGYGVQFAIYHIFGESTLLACGSTFARPSLGGLTVQDMIDARVDKSTEIILCGH